MVDWLDKVGLVNDTWLLLGSGIQTRFTLQFQGDPGIGAINCKRARDYLQNADGSWKELQAKHISGATVKIYVNGDKSKQRFAEERALRRLEVAAGRHDTTHAWGKRKGR